MTSDERNSVCSQTPEGLALVQRSGWIWAHSLVELLGELDDLRGQRHAGLHHHQVAGAGGVALPLGALRRPLPLLVLDRHVGSVLHQSLDSQRQELSFHTSGNQRLHSTGHPAPGYLDTGEVSVLRRHVDGCVSVLVHFVQGDGLFLHELQQPQQNLLLHRTKPVSSWRWSITS